MECFAEAFVSWHFGLFLIYFTWRTLPTGCRTLLLGRHGSCKQICPGQAASELISTVSQAAAFYTATVAKEDGFGSLLTIAFCYAFAWVNRPESDKFQLTRDHFVFDSGSSALVLL